MVVLLTILHVVVAVFLILVVLLQTGKGAEIGASFGGASNTLFGSSGPGRATVLVANSDDVLIQAVATNPGAIGLVDVYSITGAVSVLKVDGKSPLEPGYALHGN